jgi:diguanylate cyclase (GGDEF)-like protein/putative nucleotidyltransferase with HDIG domain
MSTRRRILLAEDNREHQHLLLLALAQSDPDMELCVVDSGEAFLRSLGAASRPYHCVVVDFCLPDLQADQLLIRAHDLLGDTPVIVISSSEDQRVAVSCFRCGVTDFVPKSDAVVGCTLGLSIEKAIETARRQRAERRKAERRERELARLAETDALTGLYNRRYLRRCLEQQRWQRDRRRQVAAMMLDLDHFKRINDQYGHGAGDRVLQAVAQNLSDHSIGGDVVVRYGGEEILLIRTSVTPLQAALEAERLRLDIASLRISVDGEQAVQPSASIGLCHASSHQFNAQTIEQADEALYLAKHMGRDCVCTWPMVAIEKQLQRVAEQPGSVRQRRTDLLQRCDDRIGPTQRVHIDDHCEQVAELSAQLARTMGLDQALCRRIELAGLLHDIGKIMLPEELLAKPSSLSTVEWVLMSRHGRLGGYIARRLGADEQTVADVTEHHQRFANLNRNQADGPSHIGAQVIGVADALATMITQRAYSVVRSWPQAIAELRHGANDQFDPAVVDAACRLPVARSAGRRAA